jgi:hypothetical protein
MDQATPRRPCSNYRSGPDAAGARSEGGTGPDAAWAISSELTAALFGDVERGRAAAPLGDLPRGEFKSPGQIAENEWDSFSVCGTDGKLSCGGRGYETAAGMTRRFSFL